MVSQVSVLLSEDGADPERVDTLTGFLRGELLDLDVDTVKALRSGDPPVGARAGEALAVGGLLVSLATSDQLRAVVQTVRRWLSRGAGVARTVRLEVDGDVLELRHASAADQARLVELFIARHEGT